MALSRWVGGGVVLLAVVLVFSTGLVDWLRDPAQVQRDIASWGAAGQLGFVALYALTQPFGAPGTVLFFAAPLIWPWPIAFLLSMTAAVLGTSLGFTVARHLARDWIRPKLPARILAYEASLTSRAFRTVFLMRLIFGMQQSVHAVCGLSTVGFWTHLVASAAAYVPPLLAIAILGDELLALARAIPGWVFVLGATLVVLAVLAAYLVRRRRG